MSRHLRLIAAVAVVLVAVSGFSPNRKGGGRSSHSKGGGCSSSSSSSHNSNSSGSGYDSVTKDDHDSDDGYSGSRRYNSTTGTSGSRNGTVRNTSPSGTVTRCAAQSGSDAKAVVEVKNPKGYGKTYRVEVAFLDTSGTRIDSGTAQVEVGSRTSAPVDVRMAHPGRVGDVSECRLESVR